ncbi:Os10g0580550 [Oryza sativa Japonica Group]|uniref:Os10g0580550 protein n=1 Tax=Oryza sativa subsp. japonica TaxID=39947 RepID=A0A0P0XXZ9_ORYSJ|nr:Os10g0580550 [Oryza sativa Japonica Group]
MHSIHCMHRSKTENSNGGRTTFLTSLSILPLEIWHKQQCHNFDETSEVRFSFLLSTRTQHSHSQKEITNKADLATQDQYIHYYTIVHICHFISIRIQFGYTYYQVSLQRMDIKTSGSKSVKPFASSRRKSPTASTFASTPLATLMDLSLLCVVLIERNPFKQLHT